MEIRHCINKKFDEHYNKIWVPKDYRDLTNLDIARAYQQGGPGLYVNGFVSANNDIAARAISKISGKYSHVFFTLYSENMNNVFAVVEKDRILKKYKKYYGNISDIESRFSETKVLALASADSIGMNYFNYGTYQGRQQKILKLAAPNEVQQFILRDLVSEDTMGKIYDYTGLVFWWLWHALDDERAFYCSEVVYDIPSRYGVELFYKDNPSPTQIMEWYAQRTVQIYSNVV